MQEFVNLFRGDRIHAHRFFVLSDCIKHLLQLVWLHHGAKQLAQCCLKVRKRKLSSLVIYVLHEELLSSHFCAEQRAYYLVRQILFNCLPEVIGFSRVHNSSLRSDPWNCLVKCRIELLGHVLQVLLERRHFVDSLFVLIHDQVSF